MGTVTLGAEDLFPQSQIVPRQLGGGDILYEGIITKRLTPTGFTFSTRLVHGLNPATPFVDGSYFLNTLFTREVNGIPQGPGVPVPLTGVIVPGDFTDSRSIPGDYNVIQILGGSGFGVTQGGQQFALLIERFTVLSRVETVVVP